MREEHGRTEDDGDDIHRHLGDAQLHEDYGNRSRGGGILPQNRQKDFQKIDRASEDVKTSDQHGQQRNKDIGDEAGYNP